MKWSVSGKIYSSSEDVIERLPPGLYEIDYNEFIDKVFFKKIDPKTDKLYSFPNTGTGFVLDEIKKFWTKRELFEKHGFVYKRGILLYGPPGSGKTSTINVVSENMIELGAITLKMGDYPQEMSKAIEELRRVHPEVPIVVVIEDIDRLRSNTYLLDLLDGSIQVDNVVYIATTNYPDLLPPRLANRPSRFDRRIEIENPSVETKTKYLSLLTGEPESDFVEWAERTEGLSFAHLKELYVAVRILECDFDQTVSLLREMAKLPSDPDDEYEDFEECCVEPSNW